MSATQEIGWRCGEFFFAEQDGPFVMGIINVTPDSFSDGGQFFAHEEAVAHGRKLASQGAVLLDVGGESTRPGACALSVEEEKRRVLPVIERLVAEGHAISVDSSKPAVAREACRAGCVVLNDVTGLRDEKMVELAGEAGCGVVVMHMRGDPRTMQSLTDYEDVVDEVRVFFEERLRVLTQVGLAEEQIVFDPGLGFAKSAEDNWRLLAGLQALRHLGRPLLIGASRKSFLGKVTQVAVERERDWASMGLAMLLPEDQVNWHRVHDVEGTKQALRAQKLLK